MKKIVVLVPVWEFERGWGSKIDDYMVCINHERADEFVKEFNSKNTSESVPDFYMIAREEYTYKDVDEVIYNKISDENKWLKSLEYEEV